jgi:hypothetical protein
VKVTRGSAALAVLVASVAFPLLVWAADPSQQTAVGFLLPAGTAETIVLDQAIDSAQIQPATIVNGHLRSPIVLRGKVLAPADTPIRMVVTATRRAGDGVSGEVVLRVEPVGLQGGISLPVHLVHPALSPLLVLANPQDIVISTHARGELHQGKDLMLPRGTLFRAATSATLDATNPEKIVVATPPPYTISTDRPYSIFTPIPLTTYNPHASPPPGRRRGRRKPEPSPSPSGTASESPAPTPTEFSTPAANSGG